MIPALKGEEPVFVHADDIKQISAALDWAREENLRMILVGGRDAWRVADRLKAAADAQAKRGWVHVRMSVAEPDQSGFGMLGSGMLVINPPFVLHPMLQEVMPVLTETLGQHAGASFLLEKRTR